MTTRLARRVGFHFTEAQARRHALAATSGEAWVPRQLAGVQATWADAIRDVPYYRHVRNFYWARLLSRGRQYAGCSGHAGCPDSGHN